MFQGVCRVNYHWTCISQSKFTPVCQSLKSYCTYNQKNSFSNTFTFTQLIVIFAPIYCKRILKFNFYDRTGIHKHYPKFYVNHQKKGLCMNKIIILRHFGDFFCLIFVFASKIIFPHFVYVTLFIYSFFRDITSVVL